MRERNMWISEPGRERNITNPAQQDSEIGKTALSAPDEEVVVDVTGDEPAAAGPLASSGMPLDDLVLRSWKSWE